MMIPFAWMLPLLHLYAPKNMVEIITPRYSTTTPLPGRSGVERNIHAPAAVATDEVFADADKKHELSAGELEKALKDRAGRPERPGGTLFAEMKQHGTELGRAEESRGGGQALRGNPEEG